MISCLHFVVAFGLFGCSICWLLVFFAFFCFDFVVAGLRFVCLMWLIVSYFLW